MNLCIWTTRSVLTITRLSNIWLICIVPLGYALFKSVTGSIFTYILIEQQFIFFYLHSIFRENLLFEKIEKKIVTSSAPAVNMLFLTPKISKDEAKTIKHVTTFHLKDDARKMGKKGKNYFLRRPLVRTR